MVQYDVGNNPVLIKAIQRGVQDQIDGMIRDEIDKIKTNIMERLIRMAPQIETNVYHVLDTMELKKDLKIVIEMKIDSKAV